MKRREVRLLLTLLLLLAMATFAWGYIEATSMPRVRRAEVVLDDWPANAAPVKALLISDTHVAGPDMPPARLTQIVARANALHPDLVLLVGDFVSDKALATRTYSTAEAIAPLGGFRAPLGTIAVLGNHDHWRNAAQSRQALERAGITVLVNRAIRRGPLVVAGADDIFTRHADVAAMTRDAARFEGPAIMLSHSPDVAPRLDRRFQAVLAGHTHCGQIAPPLIGPLSTESRYGRRYACGLVRESGRTTIVTAGLGTSMVPLRIGAPPDMWLVTFRGKVTGPARK